MIRNCAMLFAFLFVSAGASADEIDDFVKKTMDSEHLPGVAIGIFQNGKPVLTRAYGLADLQKKIPVQVDTPFRIASMSKAFCSASVMMLVRDGKIALDSPITTYLMDAPKTWEKVTVRHLLHHQSGIPNVTDLTEFKFAKDWKEEEFIQFLKDRPLTSEPGSVYKYNNSGYSILGILVHRVSGKPLSELVKANIFDKLEKKDSSYAVPEKAAVGYEWRKEAHVPATKIRPGAMMGSGGVCTNLADLAKWDQSWFGNALFSNEEKEKIWTPGVLTGGKSTVYAMGWTIRQKPEGRQISHSGSTAGFTSNWLRQTWDKTTVVVLRNVQAPGADKMAEEIMNLYRKRK